MALSCIFNIYPILYITVLSYFAYSYIRWPETQAERNKVSQGFAEGKKGRPCVLGCVDGTHIALISPAKGSEAAYVNRKGWYSMNTMVGGAISLPLNNNTIKQVIAIHACIHNHLLSYIIDIYITIH